MKYIIEIAKEYEEYFKGILICGIAEGKFAVDVIAKEDLEELNSDYINEHFSDLQNTAYKKGLEDGKGVSGKGCEGCEWEGTPFDACERCCNSYKNMWTAKQTDDVIKVGDEVAFHHDDGRPDTVVVVTYIGQDGFIDGMDGRGTQYAHKNPTKWTKTGRHFDIASILKEMRT